MEIGKIERPPAEIIDGFRQISSSTIGGILDDMGINGIIPGLKILVPGARIAGPAFTAKATTGVLGTYTRADWPVEELIDSVQKDDLLVFDMGGQQVSSMGGLGSLCMKLHGVAGMVVDGGVRDAEQITSFGFPAYVRHTCAIRGRFRVKLLGMNVPVKIGDVRVNPGDIVVADDTSIAVVPAGKAEEVLRKGQRREEIEQRFEKELRKGKGFLETTKNLGL